ncbi:alpha/beta-hydrolase [Cystobasidium minutum MCA 4210]|uniref:alpha/beta-hydrolase n=1 Tax=Cystobasidium minutum MCA 4210 TaxID=1397322 RepID=UPI0034CDCEE0|eukprot:jgi/Rhomi1/193019/gm1.1233_g
MHFKTTSLLIVAASLLAITNEVSVVQAKYTCDTSLGNFYPYCVNVPDNAKSGQKFPTIMMLSGSGARGPASQVKMLSGYDGDGKLLNQYFSGNRGQAQKAIAEQFVVIIPIMPHYVNGQEQRHFFPEHLDKIYDQIRSKGYPVDWDRLHVTGYSAGGRSAMRQGVERPHLYASIANCAGPGEKPGAGTLSQQKASSVLDRVSNMKHIPVMQFAGRRDTTVGQSSPKEQQDALVKSGNVNPQLIWLDTDHHGMSTKPFEDMRMINFFLNNRRNGAAAPPKSDEHDDKKDDEKKDDEKKEDEKKEDDKKDDGKKEDDKKQNDGRVKVDLKPVASATSLPHKQFNAEPPSGSKTEDDDTKATETSTPSQVAKPSSGSNSGKCLKKKVRRANKRALSKRTLGEEGYAHPGPVRRGVYASAADKVEKRDGGRLTLAKIVQDVQDLKVKIDIEKRSATPLESLKAHAGSRRSHVSSDKLGRRFR